MYLKECKKCKHYIVHENYSVMCFYYEDLPMARTLLPKNKGVDGFIIDCPIEPKIVKH